ncbi:alpha/beta fold hydrolase [Chlorobium phaeobacteroides]|jgi:pimeloyl-ACP methyl ester carboxylesterase|uniref:Alpha/beta hydrolase fold protein n=1 Tax=Chlorobium phaeobacteroides (strain DSM 266 / SMG 266 / 2430) TaxID=290317 RepID=A1BD87_CHLPD|nr:alpha/beta hydrolase [Chlorobium phaeobacteroides]ABL64364.1 alpha/beta hydrolase fold protein [Chlorobium phaeobacteroides DSM 266]MBV5319994.1 alpha/beta hydrolase [Chlorobium phaeobacteroides]
MSYLASSRCKLYYEDSAEANPAHLDKPAVLFVNGWAISSRYWKPLVQALSGSFRCIIYDQSGTGKTLIKGHNPSFTIQGFADEAGELIEHLGLNKSRNLHIVGHSMGGMVATELSLRYKTALVSSAIIACGIFEETAFTSFGLFFLGGLIDVSMNFRNVFQSEPFRSMFIKRAATKEIAKEYGDIIIEDFTQSDKDATNAAGKFSIDPEALRAYTRHVIEIASPVLCCVGMADHTIPPEGTITLFETRKARSSAPTTLVQFMNLGHLPMLEDTDNFAEALIKHFDSARKFHENNSTEPARCKQYQIS